MTPHQHDSESQDFDRSTGNGYGFCAKDVLVRGKLKVDWAINRHSEPS